MSEYVIMTDSSSDLPAPLAKELELEVVPLTFTIGGKEYANYLDEREISTKEIYNKLRAGEVSVTSAINVDTMTKAIEPQLQAGKDVLCLMFSSALSTTCNSAQIAAKELSEKYPDRKIYVVDTLCASLGEGMLVYLAAKERLAGKTIEEVRDFAERNKLHLCHWFTVDDLHFLHRGGRVSKSSAILGSMLQIKPVLHVSDEGKLVNVLKIRGKDAPLTALAEKLFETAVEPEKQTIFISHGDCEDKAQKLADIIRAKYPVKDVIMNYVGPVIGSHSGPGTLALFFIGTKR